MTQNGNIWEPIRNGRLHRQKRYQPFEASDHLTGEALKSYVRKYARQATVLLPTGDIKGVERDEGWKLDINADVGAEL